MIFNAHSRLEGKHAFLSPSNYHWINYSEEKLAERFTSSMAARRGTELHDFAHEAIRLGIKLPTSQNTLNLYVNDGIGYKMEVEQPLFYSDNCFGHADTLAFRSGFLRIHDLKTGTIPGSHHQLMIYAALFCLEYIVSPFEIDVELRIYQNDDVQSYSPFPESITHLMDKIILFDQKVNQMKEEGTW